VRVHSTLCLPTLPAPRSPPCMHAPLERRARDVALEHGARALRLVHRHLRGLWLGRAESRLSRRVEVYG
jgi:hypothetical protein